MFKTTAVTGTVKDLKQLYQGAMEGKPVGIQIDPE